MVFEAGSIKGNRKCCEIEIENDDLVEETEIFLVHARVHEGDCGRPEIQIQCLNDCGSSEGRDSGSGKGGRRLEDSGSGGSGSEGCETKTVEVINVQFGGSIDKCTGTLKVNILDDDGKAILLVFFHWLAFSICSVFYKSEALYQSDLQAKTQCR